MAMKIQEISPSAQLAASVATLYTAPANTRAWVKRFTVTNTTGTAATVTVYLVPSGGSASAANTVVSARAVAPGETIDLWEVCQALAPGSMLQALSGTAAALTVRGSALEVV